MPPNNLPETVTDEKRQLHLLPSPAQCLYRTERKKETSLESTRFVCPSSFCVTHLAGYHTLTLTLLYNSSTLDARSTEIAARPPARARLRSQTLLVGYSLQRMEQECCLCDHSNLRPSHSQQQ
ncbi:unnamed protein product [Eretmochelys imbricata]